MTASPLSPFRVQPKNCGFDSRIDILKLNQLCDLLALGDFQAKLAGTAAYRGWTILYSAVRVLGFSRD